MKNYHSKRELTDDIEFIQLVIPNETISGEKTLNHLINQLVEQWRLTSPDSPWHVRTSTSISTSSSSSSSSSSDSDSDGSNSDEAIVPPPLSLTAVSDPKWRAGQTEKDAANTLINIHNTVSTSDNTVGHRRSNHYNLRNL